MREIEDKISLFVKDQFPAFYAEEGIVFKEFLGAYYEYLETTGKTLDIARNQLEYRDIDKTTAEFLDQFKKTYLADLPGLIKSDDRLTIKNILDFYKAKGSQRSIQLLFRILFDDAATVHYPSEDVIRPSDAKFFLPRYIEVYAPSYDKLKSLEGIEIIGATTQAKAFVETISTKLLNGIRTNVLRLSNVRGDFNRGEVISKSSDGIQDDMPVITGSLSDITVTLGGSNNQIGDVFNITSVTGKQGKARVTGIDDATGLVSFTLNDGGFGFTNNTTFTTIDINSQNIQLDNIINAAQSYSNSSMIDNAKYFEFETVTQDMERVTILSGSNLIANVQTYMANTEKTTNPIIKGLDSANNEIANGYLIALDDVLTDNATITIAPYYGTFGPARSLTVTPVDATHIFEANGANEPIDEESTIAISYISNTAAFTDGTVVTQANSGANGIIDGSNSTAFTVNGAFGTFNTTDDIEYGSSDTANVIGVSITTSGANAVIATSNSTKIVVSDVVGEFNPDKKVKGRRTNSIATIDTSGVTDTGASDLVIVAADYDDVTANTEAVIDTYANVSVTGQVIGSNDTNVGLRNTVYANGLSANFVANAAAFVLGDVSNTYANIALVGTGTGATFKIGGLENEDAVTIYTDIIGSNNTANISYLDCIIDGGNSGIGFLDSITINDGGSAYTNGQSIKFDRGGAGGGSPTINAAASITTNSTGGVTVLTVDTLGRGFYSASAANTGDLSTGSGLDITANFDFGYGFPKDDNGDFTSVLDTVLTRFSGNLGTITALTEINPGNNYNLNPFVKVRTAGVAGFDRRDVKLNLTSKSGTFVVGETINQTISETGQILGLTSLVGEYTNGDSFSVNTESFAVGGSLVQVINSTSNAVGQIYQTPNATHIAVKNSKIKHANGTFDVSNTAPFYVDSSNLAFFASLPNTAISFIKAEVANLQSSVSSATSKGKVKEDIEDAVLVKRLSFSVGLANNAVVTGALSGATGTVVSVEQDANSRPIGDNANLTSIAQAANGIVTSLEVTDSGFGYQHDSKLTLVSSNADQNIVVSGTANVTTTGIGEGFWEDESSFLNNKYIHDNDLYQSYSYLIESGLSLDKYRDIVLKSAHIAGTKLFGRVTKESIVNNAITIANSSIGAL